MRIGRAPVVELMQSLKLLTAILVHTEIPAGRPRGRSMWIHNSLDIAESKHHLGEKGHIIVKIASPALESLTAIFRLNVSGHYCSAQFSGLSE
jgi:hypothetical protein